MSTKFARHLLPHSTSIGSLAARLFFSRAASTLFVKGISFSSTQESLVDAFSQYGQILEVNILKNKVNKPKGFAYVTFASDTDAEKALKEMNGKLVDGRIVFVDSSKPQGFKRSQHPIELVPTSDHQVERS